METQKKTNVTGGVFAALIFLLLVGVFVGLPIIVWVFLGAALVGLWVAHFYDRDRSSDTARPWQRS